MSTCAWKLVLPFMMAGIAAGCNGSKSTSPAPITFHTTLTPAGEVPPTTSTATGVADVTISGNTLTYTVTWSGLTSATFAAHFHSGTATTSNGPVVFGFSNLGTATSGSTSGTIDLTSPNVYNMGTSSVIPGDSLRKLFVTGNIYTNVHSANYHGGEIRGQMTPP